MSDYQERLEEMVLDGRLRLAAVVGTQRSGSTLAAKAMAQLTDMSLDGPFREIVAAAYSKKKLFNIDDEPLYDKLCEIILKKAEAVLAHQDRAHITVKAAAGHMSPRLLHKWLPLVSSMLVTYRDPPSQFISYARAFYGNNVAHTTRPSGVAAFVDEILPTIENTIFPPMNETIIQANEKRWSLMAAEMKIIREVYKARIASRRPLLLASIEATLMRSAPRRVWEEVARKIDLPSDSADQLLAGPWKHDFTSCGIEANAGAYKERVSRSASIDPPLLKEKVELANLSQAVLAHIGRVSPLYIDLLQGRENAFLPEDAHLEVSVEKGQSLTLAHVNPFLANALKQLQGEKSPEVQAEAQERKAMPGSSLRLACAALA